jgi:hypothetical protein
MGRTDPQYAIIKGITPAKEHAGWQGFAHGKVRRRGFATAAFGVVLVRGEEQAQRVPAARFSTRYQQAVHQGVAFTPMNGRWVEPSSWETSVHDQIQMYPQ